MYIHTRIYHLLDNMECAKFVFMTQVLNNKVYENYTNKIRKL